MRFIKAFIAGVLGLFIIITLLSLLIPSKVQVIRTVLINNTTINKVSGQITDIKKWKNWHPVFTIDSAVISMTANAAVFKIVHREKDLFISILSADTNAIKFLVQSKAASDLMNVIHFASLPGQEAVQVSWQATTQLHWYPWEKFYAIFMDKLTGPGYEQALNGLKDYLERSQ